MAYIDRNRSYADKVAAHNGRAPSDMQALCVIEFFEKGSANAMFGVFYPHHRGDLAMVLSRAESFRVMWVDEAIRSEYPMLFPEPAGA